MSLSIDQLKHKLLSTTPGSVKYTVITNQIARLVKDLTALLPTRPAITKRRYTTLEALQQNLKHFTQTKRGYLLYNPVKNTYLKNSKKNKDNVQKQIHEYNANLFHTYYTTDATFTT